MNKQLFSALYAGIAVGLLVALLQFLMIEDKIVLAEEYESGQLVHYQGLGDSGHDHEAVEETSAADAVPQAGTEADATAEAADGHDHDHHHDGEETSPLVRHLLSVFFASIIYVGYALAMSAGFAFANRQGRHVGVTEGLLWGLAGFAAFQMSPAMGLEPELPGTMAAALELRQIWWVGCAVATVIGIACLAYGRGVVPWVVGIVLLAAPHVIGAPELETFSGVTPPELASSFAARSLGVGLIGWVTLGGLLAWFWNREAV